METTACNKEKSFLILPIGRPSTSNLGGGENSCRLVHLSDLHNQLLSKGLTSPDISLWRWLMRFPLCNHHLLTAPQLLQTGLLYEDQRVEGMERVTVCFLKILKVCLRLASPLSETWVVFALLVIKILWRLTGLCGGHTYHTLRDYRQHMQPICDVHTWFIGTQATELHAPPKHPGTLSWRTHKSHCAWRDP